MWYSGLCFSSRPIKGRLDVRGLLAASIVDVNLILLLVFDFDEVHPFFESRPVYIEQLLQVFLVFEGLNLYLRLNYAQQSRNSLIHHDHHDVMDPLEERKISKNLILKVKKIFCNCRVYAVKNEHLGYSILITHSNQLEDQISKI